KSMYLIRYGRGQQENFAARWTRKTKKQFFAKQRIIWDIKTHTWRSRYINDQRRTTAMIKSVRGTRDLLPPETELWNFVEATVRDVFRAYNFHEIRTPMLADNQLFM